MFLFEYCVYVGLFLSKFELNLKYFLGSSLVTSKKIDIDVVTTNGPHWHGLMKLTTPITNLLTNSLIILFTFLNNNTKLIWVLDFRHNITVLPECSDPITGNNGQPSSPSITRLRAIACK